MTTQGNYNVTAYPDKDRILGQQIKIKIHTTNGPVPWAACDSFDAQSQTKSTNFQPLGNVAPRPQLIYGGYKLTFKGGQIDETVDQMFLNVDQNLLQGKSAPRYTVDETINLFDGTVQTWVYPDAVLFAFKRAEDKADGAITYDFEGEAPLRYPTFGAGAGLPQ